MTRRKRKGFAPQDPGTRGMMVVGGCITFGFGLFGMFLEMIGSGEAPTPIGPSIMTIATLVLLIPLVWKIGESRILPTGQDLLDDVDEELNRIKKTLRSDALHGNLSAKETLPLLTKRRNTLLAALKDIRNDDKGGAIHDPDERTAKLQYVLEETTQARRSLEDLRDEMNLLKDLTDKNAQALEAETDDIRSHLRTLRSDTEATRQARNTLQN